MKAITLHTPMPDNGGTRRDAGETLVIGDGGDEIALELAQALVDAGSAVEGIAESKAAARKAKTLPDAASDEAE